VATIPMYSYTTDEIETTCKLVMDSTLFALVAEEIIEEKIAFHWAQEHAIVMRRRTFFERLFKSKKEKADTFCMVVKRVTPVEFDTNEPSTIGS